MLFNIYCDESCHLEHDGINVMVLGSIWCPQSKLKEINHRIQEIKARNGIKKEAELKWTKLSPSQQDAYLDLINYFFDDDDLHIINASIRHMMIGTIRCTLKCLNIFWHHVIAMKYTLILRIHIPSGNLKN